LMAHAHVMLPIAPWTETAGTFVNMAHQWQSFKGVAKGLGSSRPGWKVLRVLGNYLQLTGFDYKSSEEIKDEVFHNQALKDEPAQMQTVNFKSAKMFTNNHLSRIGDIPIYALDPVLRRAEPLQTAQTVMMGEVGGVARIHPETARRFQLDTVIH